MARTCPPPALREQSCFLGCFPDFSPISGSWLMRITCDRCGKDRMLNEAHMQRSDMPIRNIIARMRHDGCGGRAGRWSC